MPSNFPEWAMDSNVQPAYKASQLQIRQSSNVTARELDVGAPRHWDAKRKRKR